MKLVWSAPAVAHLDAIRKYIEEDSSPHYAERFVQRLVVAPERPAAFPASGRVVLESDGRHREVIARPYRLIHRVESEVIYIVAVIHGSRELDSSMLATDESSR